MKTWRALNFWLILSLSLGLALGACSGDDEDPGTDAGTDAAIEDGGEEDGSSGNDEDVIIDDGLSWQAPEALDQTDETVGSVALAVHAGGDFQAVWSEQQVSGQDVIMGRLFDGSAWAAPQALTEPGFSCEDPAVGFGSGGRAVMIYERTATGMAVWGNASDGQDAWGDELEIYAGGTAMPEWLDMGGPVGVWYLAAMGGASIWSVSRTGANWSEAVELGDSSLDGDGPRVAANNGGDGMAVWCAGTVVYAAAVNNGDQWSAPVELYNGSAEVGDPDVAVDADGNAVAVWRWQSGDRYIEAATYTPAGGWSEPERISSGGRAAGAEPVVAMDSSGRAMAVWDENDGPDRWIFAARFIPGTGWSAVEALSREPGDAYDPAIGMNSNGKAVVVWQQEVGGSEDVWSARYLPEPGGWTEAEAIYTEADWDATFPRVEVDESGHAVAVWNAAGPDSAYNVMGAVLE